MKGLLSAFLILLSLSGCSKRINATESAASIDRFQRYLTTNVRYPKDAREKKKSGQLVIAFRVKQDKSIADLKVLKGFDDNNSCESEVLRSMRSYNSGLNVKPGIYTCFYWFLLDDGDAGEINGVDQEKGVKTDYKNFLFEVTTIAIGVAVR